MGMSSRIDAPPTKGKRADGYWTTIQLPQLAKDPISWAMADSAQLADAVAHWTEAGNAITLGRTSDGGALSVTLLAGGERKKLYAANADELDQLLTAIAGG